MRTLVLLSFITYSMCIEVNLPWMWQRDKGVQISSLVVPVFNFDGNHEYISLFIFKSLKEPVAKVTYKGITIYTNPFPDRRGCNRIVYHMVGVTYEVIIITLGCELGTIKAAYYIVENKIYDIWTVHEVMTTMLEGHSQLLKQIVSNMVYSKIPNMLYIRTFDIESIKNGSLALLRTNAVRYYPNEFIDPLVNSVLERVLVARINEHDLGGPSGIQNAPLNVIYSSDDDD